MHAQSRIPRCPRTAPAKSEKDGVQKLSTMSLIPQKIKAHPISSLRSALVAEISKQDVVPSKALTTPIAKKKCPSGTSAGRSVQNQKLQEPTPMKKAAVKVGTSSTVKKPQKAAYGNCKTPVSEVCYRMNKLQISSSQTKNATGHLSSVRKGATTRATDLVPSKSAQIDREASTRQEQNDQQVTGIDDQTQDRSSVLPGIQGNHLVEDLHQDCATDSEKQTEKIADENLRCSDELAREEEEVRDNSSTSDKENSSILSEKAIAEIPAPTSCASESSEVHEVGGKIRQEDSMVFDDNKENAPGNHDGDKDSIETIDHVNRQYPQKSTEEAHGKTLKGIATQGQMPKKMKGTNPKPFRFRTDERGILREANLEKKLLQRALKETIHFQAKSERSAGGGPLTSITPQRRKHIETGIDSGASKPKKMMKLAASSPQTPNDTPSTTATTKTQLTTKGSNCERARAKTPNKVPRNPGATNRTTSPWTRKPSTVPREPNFHRIHVPKCCTKRLENILV